MACELSPARVIYVLDALEHKNKADLHAQAGHSSKQLLHAGSHLALYLLG